MPGFEENYIEKLKNEVDIVEVISEYVDLKKAGKNYKGLCPFHQEKTPSFTVNPQKKLYYCFGCGVGGDVLNFLMEIEHITFQESIKILARKVGLPIPDQNPYQRRMNLERERIFEVNQFAAKFYHYFLMKRKEISLSARRYLKKRGFNEGDVSKFYLGYAPKSWNSLLNFLTKKGYKREELLKAGLIQVGNNNNYYDRFRDRIIFPIFNIRGEVLAFGGRIINNTKSNPKYLNSPETFVFKKGTNLYGLNWAKEKIREVDSVIIMEGYIDVLTAHKFGIENSVASLGTALTADQASFIKRYTNNVYISYDADTAGAKAAWRGLDILKDAGLSVKVVKLPDEKDPDDFIREKGKIQFNKLLERALNIIDFKLAEMIGDKNYADPEEKIDLTRKVINLLASFNDKIEREIYLQKIAQQFQLDIGILKEEVTKVIHKKKDKIYKKRYNKKDNETNYYNNINRIENVILKFYIDNLDYRDYIKNRINPNFFSRNNKDLIALLWEKSSDKIETIIDSLRDSELRKKILFLTVVENVNVSSKEIDNYINIIKEYKLYQNKEIILKKLQQDGDFSLKYINSLLLDFQHLSDNLGKEGF